MLQFTDDAYVLFECVWPFCGLGLKGLASENSSFISPRCRLYVSFSSTPNPNKFSGDNLVGRFLYNFCYCFLIILYCFIILKMYLYFKKTLLILCSNCATFGSSHSRMDQINFFKGCPLKFYLVHSWIPWPICQSLKEKFILF